MTVEAPESAVETRTAPPEGNDTGEPKPANREAKYRTERNQARDERDTLARRVEQLQTRELERLASKSLSNPADLLTLSGKTLADFVGDDGELNADLITEAANELLGTRPGLKPVVRAVDPSQGTGNDGPPPDRRKPTWGSLVRS